MPHDSTHGSAPYGHARTSAQRATIAHAVEELGGAFTIDALREALHPEHSGIGLATVYRAIAAMEASGWLQRVGDREGSALYTRCTGGAHHHHLVCTECGAVARADCPLDATVIPSAVSAGFIITHHEVTLYGLCSKCAPPAADQAGD